MKGSVSEFRIAAMATLMALIMVFPHRADGQSCVSGKVIARQDGKGIAEANISLGGTKGAISGKTGEFSICGLETGSVEVTISHIGYETRQLRIDLRPGNNALKEIELNLVRYSIEEVVVTATRTDNSLMNTPVRVNLITPRQLSNIPVQNIDEALKYSPGINYNRSFGIFSTKATVMMRGLSGKEQGRVLVLLDGVPLNKSDGGTVDWNLVDVNTIRKIEIIKGAGSSVYGGNAMGGIINIISGRPEKPFFLKASLEAGTFHTRGARLSTGGAKDLKNKGDSFYWMLSSFFKISDGYITQSEADIRSNPYIVKSDMRETGVNLKTGFTLANKHTIEASLNYYDDRRGTGEKVFQPEGNTTDHDSWGATLNYRGKIRAFNAVSTLFILNEDYKKVNEFLRDDYTWYNVLSTRRDFGWMTSFSRQIRKSHLLTGGFDFKNGSVDAYDKYFTSTDIVYNEGKMITSAVFAQDEISLMNGKLRVIAGLRFDMASFYDGSFRIKAPTMETSFMDEYQVPVMPVQNRNALSPRLSAQYRWNEGKRVYAMYSRGFRASVLDDLCRSGRIKGGFKIANPSLKPEYLNNFETGLDFTPFQKSLFSASLFYSRGKDFQYYVSNGQTIDMGFGERPIFIRANISEVEIYGAEAELRYDLLPELNLFANYAYSHSVILDYNRISGNDTIDLSGNYLTDVPEHIFSCGMTWNHKIVNSGLFLRYSGSMYINDQNTYDELLKSDKYPGYATVDLRFSRSVFRHFTASAAVYNLFDVRYYDSKYAVGPGRFFSFGITYQLK